MSDKATYLYYPGHLGPRPATELMAERGILWDAPVKRVPAAFAASLVADGGFRLALAEGEAARILSRSKKRLRELVEAGRLDGETYHPPARRRARRAGDRAAGRPDACRPQGPARRRRRRRQPAKGGRRCVSPPADPA